MLTDESDLVISCPASVTGEYELQLTKMGDKAWKWMTMFQNWSTKDKIETSIHTFHRATTESESEFLKTEWSGDENWRENL